MSERDYLAMVQPVAGDREDSGVKGMRWGVRKDERLLSDKDKALNLSQRSQVKLASGISALATIGITSNAAATLFQLQSRFEHLQMLKAAAEYAENSPYMNDAAREAFKATRSQVVKGLVGSAIATTAISSAIGIVTHRTAKAYFAPIHKVYGDAKPKINRELKSLSKDIKSGKRAKLSKKAYEAEVVKIVEKHMTKDLSNVTSPFHELARSQMGLEYNTKKLKITFEKLPNTDLASKMTVTTPDGLKLVKAIKNVEHADLAKAEDELPDLDLYFDYTFDSSGDVDGWSCPTIEIANDLFAGTLDLDAITAKFDPEPAKDQTGEEVGMTHDYIGNFEPQDGDRQDSGVKGMKWGVRRSSKQLRAAAKERAASPDHVSKAASKPAGTETAAARYSRLQTEAKAGLGKNMSDEDLKFFNARTEALKKVDALNSQKPGWLAETSKRVLLSVAEEQMKSIASNMANKHISGPINKSVNKITTKS